MDPLNAETIRKALTTARDGGFRSIKLRSGETSFQATLSEEALTWGEAWDDDSEMASGPQYQAIPAPVVGYVKWLPEVAQVGTELKAGQTIGEVLALGISNEITTPTAGKVHSVNVKDGDPVEFGLNLMEIEIS